MQWVNVNGLLWSKQTAGTCKVPVSQTPRWFLCWGASVWRQVTPVCIASDTALASSRYRTREARGSRWSGSRRRVVPCCSSGYRRPRCPWAVGTTGDSPPETPRSRATSPHCTGLKRDGTQSPGAWARAVGNYESCISHTAQEHKKKSRIKEMRASGSAMRRPWSRMGIPKYAGVGENKTRPQTLHVPKIRQRAPFPHAAKKTLQWFTNKYLFI